MEKTRLLVEFNATTEVYVPLSRAATRLQYPVCTTWRSLSQPSRHSMPKESSEPSRYDQKLKLRDEMRKIQSRVVRVPGWAGS